MALPTYKAAWETARDNPAFSNGTEGECWMEANCHQCINDSPELVDRGEGCPLIEVAILGRTPMEWTPDKPGSLGEQYRCMYFRSKDDGPDPEPTPIPDPPGQLTLTPREAIEQARMLTPLADDPVAGKTPVEVSQ